MNENILSNNPYTVHTIHTLYYCTIIISLKSNPHSIKSSTQRRTDRNVKFLHLKDLPVTISQTWRTEVKQKI